MVTKKQGEVERFSVSAQEMRVSAASRLRPTNGLGSARCNGCDGEIRSERNNTQRGFRFKECEVIAGNML